MKKLMYTLLVLTYVIVAFCQSMSFHTIILVRSWGRQEPVLVLVKTVQGSTNLS